MTKSPQTPVDLGTIAGQAATIRADDVAGVPLNGTGLTGQAWADGSHIWSLQDFEKIRESTEPTAEFTIESFGFLSHKSDTSIAEFLGDKGQVTSGNGDAEMGPSGLLIEGFIYIPPGEHTISVRSDDGFALSIGGVPFTMFDGYKGDPTSAKADFAGGLYAIEIEYFDGGGGMRLELAIDGVPVDQSALYATQDDFENPPAGEPLQDAETYHPSLTLGALVLDNPEVLNGTANSGHD